MSELDGLHLNVSVPTYGNEMAGSDEKLPVLVFIHGGGFRVGSNAWPQYDLAKIVRLSKDNDSPVIGVGIK
jgi:carboxylesterase type B